MSDKEELVEEEVNRNSLRNQLAQERVELELFHSYEIHGKKKVPVYELEGVDKEKIEAEGSIWIVYINDCMNEYYQRHKERIEEEVDAILREALEASQ